MTFPKGPTAETAALVKKVVKAAGKKGKSIVELSEKLALKPSVVRRAVKYAVDEGSLAKQGQGRSTTYGVPD